MKYKVVYDCILYILYYILACIQHNGDVSLENQKCRKLSVIYGGMLISS
jgi:hypothetical protein